AREIRPRLVRGPAPRRLLLDEAAPHFRNVGCDQPHACKHGRVPQHRVSRDLGVLLPRARKTFTYDGNPAARSSRRRRGGRHRPRDPKPEQRHGAYSCADFRLPAFAPSSSSGMTAGTYAAPLTYLTAASTARFQLINRSARNPTRLFCHSDVITVVASAGLSGAVSSCTLASRLTSILTPPSSAYRMYRGCTRITFPPTTFDVPIVIPEIDPHVGHMPGNAGEPSELRIMPSVNAFVSLMISVTTISGMFVAVNVATSACMSLSTLPVVAIAGVPLGLEAGDTFVTAATAGSTNCGSRNHAIPAVMERRTSHSALGSGARRR